MNAENPTPSKRGGARKNAGKKPIHPGESMAHKTVTLDAMTIRMLVVIGEGNISEGIRRSAKVAYDRYQREA